MPEEGHRGGQLRCGGGGGGASCAPTPSEGEGGRKKRKKWTNDGLTESGRALLKECQAQMAAELLWDRRVRARDFETTLARISAKASKLSQIINKQEAAQVSAKLLKLSTTAEEHRSLFASLRSDPGPYIAQPTSDRHQ